MMQTRSETTDNYLRVVRQQTASFEEKRKETTWKMRRRWKENIKMHLHDITGPCEDVDWIHMAWERFQ
jgi:hypothetical protein